MVKDENKSTTKGIFGKWFGKIFGKVGKIIGNVVDTALSFVVPGYRIVNTAVDIVDIIKGRKSSETAE